MKESPLDAAKRIITIPLLARLRGWKWKPTQFCEVPYRPGSHGVIGKKGRRFYDPDLDEAIDVIHLLARVENLDDASACRLLIKLAHYPLMNPRPIAPEAALFDDDPDPFPESINPRAWPAVPTDL